MGNSRILQNADNQITYSYASHCKAGGAKGIDVVKSSNQLAYITAHSDGTVIGIISDVSQNKQLDKYGYGTGNYILIKHDETYVTKYAHLKYGSIVVKVGDKVRKGQVIAYMGNTGNSNGAHLHFEVRKYKTDPSWLTFAQMMEQKNFDYIDPTNYISADLPKPPTVTPKKSNETIAMEVYRGLWGNGATRIAKLKEAGYDYNTIQAIVSKIVANGGKLPTETTPVVKPTPTPTPVNTEIKAGDKVELKNMPKYSTSMGPQIGTITGTYYIHSVPSVNGRYKITTKPEYVGVAGKVTCWAKVK